MKTSFSVPGAQPNLVLTISNNYNFFHLSRFFISLFKTSFSGRAVLFAGPNTGKNSIRALRKIGVEVIRYKQAFPYVDAPHPDNFAKLPDPIHLYNFRHYLYYDYLLKQKGDFGKVLLTDVRDVVFQQDPFSFEMQDALYVAMESRRRNTGDCQYNVEWIQKGYGAEVLAEMAPHVISCAGTTLGPATRIHTYLETLLKEIITLRDAYGCADQAAHNRLLQQDRLGPVVRLYNEDTPVLTVGAELTFALDAAGYVLDGKGNRPTIVHQYDRHPSLADSLDKTIFDSPLQKYYLKLRYKLLS
ncbi:MAG: hypothetical protein EOO56_05105 [Hymenobacter sp.]|nr:MAG: hypothetical protein EOO56_05105 [Hymenobacter sp.]